MKTRVLLVSVVLAGSLVISVAASDEQPENQPDVQATEESPSSKDLLAGDPNASWGLHQSLSNCTPCHVAAENSTSEKPHLVAAVPDLCYSCHDKYDAAGLNQHGPVATGNCLLCHEAHKTENKALLTMPVPQLCRNCHQMEMLSLIPFHTDPMFEQCNNCHDPHASPNGKLLKRESLLVKAPISASKERTLEPLFVNSSGSLRGLGSVSVVPAVIGGDMVKDSGLTENFVKKQIELQLQSRGMKINPPSEKNEPTTLLNVRVRLMDVPSQRRPGQVDALSGSISVALQQTVELPPVPGSTRVRRCTATTWDSDAIFIWGRWQLQDGLKQAAEVLIGRFADDYLKANAGYEAAPPAQSND